MKVPLLACSDQLLGGLAVDLRVLLILLMGTACINGYLRQRVLEKTPESIPLFFQPPTPSARTSNLFKWRCTLS